MAAADSKVILSDEEIQQKIQRKDIYISPAAEAVLVLDSDSSVAEELSYLMDGRVNALWAKTPDEALSLLAEHPISIVIVDIGINTKTIELMRLLKQEYPHVLSIVVTERNERTLLISLINEVKVFRYLQKPYSKGLLIQYLKSALFLRDRFCAAPALVKQQAAKVVVQDVVTVTSSGLMDKVRSLASRLS